jgi:hypothetical protein
MAGGGRKQQAGLALWPPEQLDEDERTDGQAGCLAKRNKRGACRLPPRPRHHPIRKPFNI